MRSFEDAGHGGAARKWLDELSIGRTYISAATAAASEARTAATAEAAVIEYDGAVVGAGSDADPGLATGAAQ